MSTLTGAIDVALGSCFSGVFSSTKKLFDELSKAGY